MSVRLSLEKFPVHAPVRLESGKFLKLRQFFGTRTVVELLLIIVSESSELGTLNLELLPSNFPRRRATAGKSGLAVQNSLQIDKLPNGHILDPESPPGFGNPQSAVTRCEPVLPHLV
jgi:hypothetical protein